MELNYSGSGIIFYDKKEYKCDLYTNRKQGGILIKISINESIANFLELPLNIEFLSGELSTGYKFSIINCYRNKTENLISEGRTIFSYYAKYMIDGIGGINLKCIKFSKIIFEMSNIIEWGNISGYSIGKMHTISENKKCKKTIFKNEEFNIKYIVENTMLPISLDQILKENINLKQSGNIVITFKKEAPIEQYHEVLKKVKRLIELATIKEVYLKNIIGFSNNICDFYGSKRFKRSIEIISSDFNNNTITHNQTQNWKWITLSELIENSSFEKYFSKYEILEPVVELYIEIIESHEMSSVRQFLNIVQALETYHSRFKANEINDFKNRIETIILKDRPKEFKENDKKFLMANSKKFITLESRIADLLLADFNIYFDTGDIKHLDFPNIISKTRNYYIHYDEKIKENERVLKKEEISIYNKVLIYILEYYILLELGFSNIEQIRTKLNERWGNVSNILSLRKGSEHKNKD